ncbi:hypothetical protein K0M31_011936 [Melipona bicolor]|uniref:Uncharacterized protein n=1 Tax=Melipona bicolor TaxID=60889 RepID=A0AA40GAS8_9HYME|nr:hypothetical protein K0M31_011936 [Melipona bicolor]
MEKTVVKYEVIRACQKTAIFHDFAELSQAFRQDAKIEVTRTFKRYTHVEKETSLAQHGDGKPALFALNADCRNPSPRNCETQENLKRKEGERGTVSTKD